MLSKDDIYLLVGLINNVQYVCDQFATNFIRTKSCSEEEVSRYVQEKWKHREKLMCFIERLKERDIDSNQNDRKNDECDSDITPAYYRGSGMDCLDVIDAFGLDFYLGNAVKYILRAGKKDDAELDLQKAIWYLTEKCNGSRLKEENDDK